MGELLILSLLVLAIALYLQARVSARAIRRNWQGQRNPGLRPQAPLAPPRGKAAQS